MLFQSFNLDEHADRDAPAGSKPWCLWVVRQASIQRSHLESDAEILSKLLCDIKKYEAWKAIGVPSFDMLCTTQLQLSADEVEAVFKARKGQAVGSLVRKIDLAYAVAVEHPEMSVREIAAEAGVGRDAAHRAKLSERNNSLPNKSDTIADDAAATGLSTATVARQRRLKADHPDLWAKVEAGEMSTNAACIAAGIVKVPTTLEAFLKLWKKASAEEREKIRIFCNTDAT